MTSTNAPQPSPSQGVAEVFDDTIQQAPPTVSADGGVGPNNLEAPMHVGALNTIDKQHYTHWVAMTHVVWDTTAAQGQLLWSTPIHPDHSHQWLSHDAQKYYTWAGGFDYSVKVAGTGFHAGALMLVRLPPGYAPEKVRTLQDVSCFDWKQIDPKTLEVVSAGVMDQRNVMYHYFPLNLKDISTYGGYFAIFVMLPLRTSSTGVTQISLEVFTRPSRNFLMQQWIPIRKKQVNIQKPVAIEDALNFQEPKTSPTSLVTLTGFTAWTKKSKPLVNSETNNTYNFAGETMQEFKFPPFSAIDYFNYKKPNQRLTGMDSSNTFYSVDSAEGGNVTVYNKGGDSYFYFNKLYYYGDNVDYAYPTIGPGTGFIHIQLQKTDTSPVRELVFEAEFQTVTDDEIAVGQHVKAKILNFKTDTLFTYEVGSKTVAPDVANDSELLKSANWKFVKAVGFRFTALSFQVQYTDYAPPIDESIVTFQSPAGDTTMPKELAEVLKSKAFSELVAPSQALIFELWDEIAVLPIMPIKVSYNGLITTLPQSTDRIFKFDEPERYRMYYIGQTPITTPLSDTKLGLQSPRKYQGNYKISTGLFQRR